MTSMDVHDTYVHLYVQNVGYGYNMSDCIVHI